MNSLINKFFLIEVSSSNALFVKDLANSHLRTMTDDFWGLFFILADLLLGRSRSIKPNCRMLIENPLASNASLKFDLSSAPITNFHILANVFLGLSRNVEFG